MAWVVASGAGASAPVASGQISGVGDVLGFNSALSSLSFGKMYTVQLVSTGEWPSHVAGAIGFQQSSSHILTHTEDGGKMFIGPFGILSLSEAVSGLPANTVHDAIAAGDPVRWTVYEVASDIPPSSSGNPLGDVLSGRDISRDRVGQVVTNTGQQVAQAATDAGQQVTKAAADALSQNIPWGAIAIVGGAILLLR